MQGSVWMKAQVDTFGMDYLSWVQTAQEALAYVINYLGDPR